MFTKDFTVEKMAKGWTRILKVNGNPAPWLEKLRIPPAWADVSVDDNPTAACIATGTDAAGRKQRLYSPEHIARSKSSKFERVRGLLKEWEDIRTQIESDLNDTSLPDKTKEAALVAYLIYETGIRPGSNADTRAQVQAYGALTLQLRHIQGAKWKRKGRDWVARGVRLKFTGKKGVKQNVLVTNPYLVRVMIKRKWTTTAYSTPVFNVGVSGLSEYFATLGSGDYTPKDFRTARGTSLALELLGWRKLLPKSASKRRKIVNAALDKVARALGNTRAVSRSAYVDPEIIEKFLPAKVD